MKGTGEGANMTEEERANQKKFLDRVEALIEITKSSAPEEETDQLFFTFLAEQLNGKSRESREQMKKHVGKMVLETMAREQGMSPQLVKQRLGSQLASNGFSSQLKYFGIPIPMGYHGTPSQMGYQGTSSQMGYQGIPSQMGNQGTPSQMGNQGTPSQMGNQGTPSQMGNQGTPSQMGYRGMPSQMGNQGTPSQMGYRGMPSQMRYRGIPCLMGYGSSQMVPYYPIPSASNVTIRECPPENAQDGSEASQDSIPDDASR